MKIFHITPGLLPIPPNGWGATEKIIWEYHQNLLKLGYDSKIVYLDDYNYKEGDIVHIHIANLALLAKERNMPYYFTCHDHHAFLYGKDSPCFNENYEAIKFSIKSFVPAKYLVDYFDLPNLYYLSHGVNRDVFINKNKIFTEHKLLCVANNGFLHDASEDRKGFSYAIEAAKLLNLPITIAGPKNNKKFFEKNDFSYSKLNIIYDLNEEQLVNLYQDHTIFLHPSNLEAGHPNLTLLEAMSCGLPIVGTFEEKNELLGLRRIERDIESVKNGITDVINNYDFYKIQINQTIKQKNWTTIVYNLLSYYTETQSMKDQLLKIYKTTNLTLNAVKAPKNLISIDYKNGCKVEITGSQKENYLVKFKNSFSDDVIFESRITNGMWCAPSIEYYMSWLVEVFDSNNNLVTKDVINLENKTVRIINESPSLGDYISWMSCVESFRLKHKCKVNYFTPFKEIFKDSYTEINFYNYNESNDHEYDATYKLGCFDYTNRKLSPKDFRTQNLQQIGAEILGLNYKDAVPNLVVKNNTRPISEKYVCISTASTAGLKHWQHEGGWQKIVDYLNNLNYKVVVIQKEPLDYMDLKKLNNVIHPETKTFDDVIKWLNNCEFFIGLSSGVSWIAWALKKKVIMISGFTEKFNEFYTPYRIINENVCHGCWNNTEYVFDKSDWNYCPKYKNTNQHFECSKKITSEDVVRYINQCITDTQNIEGFVNFDKVVYDEIFVHQQYELFQKIEENDLVVDLGCSKGYLYFKNKNKNINYIGIDGSIDCLKDFKLNLKNDNKPIIINALLSDSIDILNNKSMFHDNAKLYPTITITFENLINMVNRKIDFMKFDIEGFEYLLLNNNYDLFKKYVKKFSGEIHFCGENFIRSEVYKTLDKLKNDNQIEFKLFSIDGVDITNGYWNNRDYYREIIINGRVLLN